MIVKIAYRVLRKQFNAVWADKLGKLAKNSQRLKISAPLMRRNFAAVYQRMRELLKAV